MLPSYGTWTTVETQPKPPQPIAATFNLLLVLREWPPSSALFLCGKLDLDAPDDPGRDKDTNRTGEYDQRLPHAGGEGVVVSHHQLPVPELIDKVSRLDSQRRSADGVELSVIELSGMVAWNLTFLQSRTC
jgi:hypothetical protein